MNLLYVDRPLVINPALAEKIGLNEAIILQQLNYWLTRTESGVLKNGKVWIYNTYAEWHEQVPFFSERTIQRIMLKLERMGVVESEMLNKSKGDRTKFYTINQDHDLLKSSCQTGTTIAPEWHHHSARVAPPSCQSGTLSTETNSETTHKDLLSGKPDVASKIIQHLNEKTGSKFRATKTNVKFIDARIAEGATPTDLIAVIDRKCLEWLDNPEMRQYLRPSTLFNAEKFNTYIGQLDSPLPAKRQAQPGHMSRHTGFDEKDYKNGLIEQEDGSYAF